YEEVEKRAAAQTSARKPGAHPENALEPMREAFRPLDEYNRERLPRDFEQRLGQELGSETGLADWVAAPFTRATLLARGWQRWFRYLAKRLRTAHYLAPTGVEFRRQARLQAVYVAERSEGWLMRAYEEVWDRRPTEERREEAPRGAELEGLKRHLAEDWIGKQ